MCDYQLVGYSSSGNLVVNFGSLRRSRIVRCQFFGLYLRWTLCCVPICGSALYFVFRVTISAFRFSYSSSFVECMCPGGNG